MTRKMVVAITGASGVVYGTRLVEVLLRDGVEVHLIISNAGRVVLEQELGLQIDRNHFRPEMLGLGHDAAQLLRYYQPEDGLAALASGSFQTDGMAVCPCSCNTLGAIANGITANLIHRAAEVHLKERRKLVLVPRETPLSLIQIDNMKRATEAGAVVLPASPGFYHGVREIGDLVDFVVARICAQFGLAGGLVKGWGAS